MGKKVDDDIATVSNVVNVGNTGVSISKESGVSLYRIAVKELEKLEKVIAKNKDVLSATHFLSADYERISNKLIALEGKHAHLKKLVSELQKELS